jgi:hypothetical protein
VRCLLERDRVAAARSPTLGRLADALNELDARVLSPGSESLPIDAAMLARAALWQFGTRHGAIDVLHEVPGALPYDDLRRGALKIGLGDMHLAIAGLDDLIAMKRASGRPTDLEDIAALTATG